jgi:predicted unusual protein kinase regulating ubiquinone biosynthesis (AarF/ABC1/UbiB family)
LILDGGNIFVTYPDRKGEFQVVLLDNGLYKSYDDTFRLNYSHLWLSIFNGDEASIKKYAHAMGGVSSYQLLSSMLTARSWDT